jgi:hypothetical protein
MGMSVGPQDGMPGLAVRHTRDGCEALLAVEREHVLAPVVGRRVLGGDVGRPVAHHLLVTLL